MWRKKKTQRVDPISWYSPKVHQRKTALFGSGIFARAPIEKDEIVVIFGGRIFSHGEVDRVDPQHDNVLQIEDDFYVASDPDEDPGSEWVGSNHSCDPNVGVRGQVTMVAMRAIRAGEELCYDYAMSESSPHFRIARCVCGTKRRRGVISGSD